MNALYTALAILGWVSFCALIAWFVGSVLDYIGDTRENDAREFADSDGRMEAGGQNLLTAGGVADTEHDRPSLTRNTHIFLSGPLSGTEA
jgi:hypothetical protein